MKSGNDDVAPLMRALVILQLETLRAQGVAVKAEVLLYRAGLGLSEIAALLDKNYAATAKTISRAKSGGDSSRRLSERDEGP